MPVRCPGPRIGRARAAQDDDAVLGLRDRVRANDHADVLPPRRGLPMTGRFLSRLWISLALAFAPIAAHAQGLDIGTVVGNEAALPIAVVPMPYQGGAIAPETDVASVIRADLNR